MRPSPLRQVDTPSQASTTDQPETANPNHGMAPPNQHMPPVGQSQQSPAPPAAAPPIEAVVEEVMAFRTHWLSRFATNSPAFKEHADMFLKVTNLHSEKFGGTSTEQQLEMTAAERQLYDELDQIFARHGPAAEMAILRNDANQPSLANLHFTRMPVSKHPRQSWPQCKRTIWREIQYAVHIECTRRAPGIIDRDWHKGQIYTVLRYRRNPRDASFEQTPSWVLHDGPVVIYTLQEDGTTNVRFGIGDLRSFNYLYFNPVFEQMYGSIDWQQVMNHLQTGFRFVEGAPMVDLVPGTSNLAKLFALP